MVYNENPIQMDDLGVPLFSETSISAFFVEIMVATNLVASSYGTR